MKITKYLVIMTNKLKINLF